MVVLPSGEWYGYPATGEWGALAKLQRLDEAQKHPTPEAAGMKRTGEWRTMGWPEDAKEAEYEL